MGQDKRKFSDFITLAAKANEISRKIKLSESTGGKNNSINKKAFLHYTRQATAQLDKIIYLADLDGQLLNESEPMVNNVFDHYLIEYDYNAQRIEISIELTSDELDDLGFVLYLTPTFDDEYYAEIDHTTVIEGTLNIKKITEYFNR